MSSITIQLPPGVILLPPGDGRHYSCGPMQSVFLADGEDSGDRYSVSIWWVDPGKPGPAGALNVFIPGGFEANMPAIVEWYRVQAQR